MECIIMLLVIVIIAVDWTLTKGSLMWWIVGIVGVLLGLWLCLHP